MKGKITILCSGMIILVLALAIPSVFAYGGSNTVSDNNWFFACKLSISVSGNINGGSVSITTHAPIAGFNFMGVPIGAPVFIAVVWNYWINGYNAANSLIYSTGIGNTAIYWVGDHTTIRYLPSGLNHVTVYAYAYFICVYGYTWWPLFGPSSTLSMTLYA